MRILLINSEYPPVGGGASNASANIASYWVEEGHDVTVITAHYQGFPQNKVENGVRVIRIPAGRKKLDRSGPFEQLVFMFAAMWHMWRLTLNWTPDVSVAFFGVPSGPAALLLKWWKGVPYIVSLRGSDVPGFRSYDFAVYHWFLAPLIKLIWRQASEVIANSEGLRGLATNFDPTVPIQVISNGVNSNQFHVSIRQWEPPVLLTVGRLVHQKGIDVLFRGLASLKEMDWKLMVVGDGKDRNQLEMLTTKLEIHDRVEFVGWQPRDALIDYYQAANLYVHPSHDEGMSNAILEAMACGLPVLATDVSGNIEVILDGKTGMLIPPGDSHSLRQVLKELLIDPERRRAFGTAGRERVVHSYSWEQTSQQYIEVFLGINKVPKVNKVRGYYPE